MSAKERLGGIVRGLQARGRGSWYKLPAYWRLYIRRTKLPIGRATSVDEVDFVVLDTECTGFDHKVDRVISFGALKVRGNTIDIASAVDWRIRADLPSSAGSIEVHGVLNNELEEGISQARFVQLLAEYVGNSVIIAYRTGFDMAILNRIVREHTGGRLTNRTLDLFDLGMRVDYPLKPRFVNPEAYRFDRLCERYGIEQPARHTSLGDAYASAELFVRLKHLLKEQGNETLGQLLRSYN